jgi:hypothetical protein
MAILCHHGSEARTSRHLIHPSDLTLTIIAGKSPVKGI